MWVSLGSVKSFKLDFVTNSILADPTHEVIDSVAKVILHPNYNKERHHNDLALLKLSSPVTYSDKMRRVCLPKPGEHYGPGSHCFTTGWGLTRHINGGKVVFTFLNFRILFICTFQGLTRQRNGPTVLFHFLNFRISFFITFQGLGTQRN